MEGRKDDAEKVRMDLLAPEFLFATAEVLTYGAAKYAPRNWEKGMAWGRCFAALMRHMWCWWGGKGPTTHSFLFGELDDDTGFSHLWHASCCLMFLIAYEQRSAGQDDRFAPGAPPPPAAAVKIAMRVDDAVSGRTVGEGEVWPARVAVPSAALLDVIRALPQNVKVLV